MKIIHRCIPVLFLSSAAFSAQAGKVTTAIEHTDFSNGYGQRSIARIEAVGDFDSTTVVVNAAYGERDYTAGKSFTGSRVTGVVYHKWSESLSTRTGGAYGSNDPVFVKRDLFHDFNIKFIPNTVLTIGGRYAEYYGGVYLNAWSAGGSYYFERLTVAYRYTNYQMSFGGNTDGHVLSLRLKDDSGDGSTQLWLGKGTSLHNYDWLTELRDGDSKSVSLVRIQPITKNLTLSATVGKAWYDTPVIDYDGITGGLSLTYDW